MYFFKLNLLSIFVFLMFNNLTAQINSKDSNQIQTKESPINRIDANLLNIFKQPNPKKYKINAIQVVGNQYFDENLLLSISAINVGDEVTIPGTDHFAKVIKKLMNQNYFKDVSVYITNLDSNKIDIEINVIERPRLARYVFYGVKTSEKEELSAKTGLIVNRVITENMKSNAVFAIKSYYLEKGYRDTRVIITELKDTTIKKNTLSLIFNVTKGKKAFISDIYFGGNTVTDFLLKKKLNETHERFRFTLFPPLDTPKIVKKKEYSFSNYVQELGFLTYTKTKKVLNPFIRIKFSSAKFNQDKYNEDKQKIINYYNSIGYRDVYIEKDTVYKNFQGNVNIEIKINEGKKYYFGNITWRGNTKYPDSILSSILKIRKGDVYNQEFLEKRLGSRGASDDFDISGLYQDDGYLFFRSEPIEVAVYNDTIDYEIKIVEGPQATIKNVRISGNEKTKEYVIRRELRTLPGDKFSRTALIRSQRELAQFSFIDPEKISINPKPNPEEGTVDIEYGIVEKSSDQLELSAGWGGLVGLTGTIGVTFNNFSSKNIFNKNGWDPLPVGDGQKLSVRFQSNGVQYQSANLSFTNPWFGGQKRNTFTWSLFYTRFASVYNQTTGQYSTDQADNQNLSTLGFTVNFAKQLQWPDDYFSFSTALNVTRYFLKNYPIDPTGLPNFDNGDANNINFKFSLQRSSVDQPLFPRSGSNILLSLQLTPPWSILNPSIIKEANPYRLIEYYKWRFKTDWYIPIGRPTGEDKNQQFVLRLTANFGFLGRYNDQLKITPFERFQVGDAGISNQYSFLGYDVISQRGYSVYSNSNPKINPEQSGASKHFTIFNKYVAELRYPLSLGASSTIYGLAFFEAANGWFGIDQYNPFELRRSVGLGMRFFLPAFGLLGFDYGFGLDRINANTNFGSAGKFTFTLGFEPE